MTGKRGIVSPVQIKFHLIPAGSVATRTVVSSQLAKPSGAS